MLIYQGKVCGKHDRQKCKDKYGNYLEWTCKKCLDGDKKIRWEDVGTYTHHILWIRTLQRSGRPMPADLFDLETWEDIGMAAEISDAINEGKGMQFIQFMAMGRRKK